MDDDIVAVPSAVVESAGAEVVGSRFGAGSGVETIGFAEVLVGEWETQSMAHERLRRDVRVGTDGTRDYHGERMT